MSPFAREFYRHRVIRVFIAGLCAQALAVQAAFWTTGYYPGYEQNGGLPAADIDFSALTHVIHFSAVPNTDGTLNSDANFITPANSTNLVALAHAAGVKVLISIGGGGTETAFQSAASAGTLPVFINSLTNFVAARGYDGVDIDWEPCPASDFPVYTNLLTGLRAALNRLSQPKLLTVAAAAYPPYGDPATGEYTMFAAIQSQLDQINIMTYDMSGPYDGWVTWFNSPIYDGGYRLPSSGTLVPSLDGSVGNFIAKGVAPGKLAIAAAFYGCVWTGGTTAAPSGITQPRQSWIKAPVATAARYTDIIANYYSSNAYQWDANVQAAYLSVTNANTTNSAFVSYEDERACEAKVNFARNKRLGGIAIWELGQDHLPNRTDPLLQAIKQAVASSVPAGKTNQPGHEYRAQLSP
ncbi:MAG TPA: glycoside hydrolase family 18 protein [Verrucomicrobiae bacterium]|nr:glycoside hydrolase family 18 protein [Verrucomicrobiae bacterium]